MKQSIKRFLLTHLLISVTIALSLIAIFSHFLNHRDIQKYCDKNLKQTALIFQERLSSQKSFKIQNGQSLTHSKNTVLFQILDHEGQRITNASEFFKTPFTTTDPGITTLKRFNKTWRVLIQHDPSSGMTFFIAEPDDFRLHLEQQILNNYFFVILWLYPFVGFLIWLIVNRGLDIFTRIAKVLSLRSTTNFELFSLKKIPFELQPVVQELNQLLKRLHEELERNRRFAGDAAHELRTPLAAVRTQTQVALIAGTKKEKEAALNTILQGVDRCTRIVQQLLTLSRMSEASILKDFHAINLHKVLSDILAQMVPTALEKNIELILLASDKKALINSNETILAILIRNIVDNAIRYTPENGLIQVQIQHPKNQILLRIEDNGPGIPPSLKDRVFERFYRTLGTKATGSGLGLAIVQQIVELHHAIIQLETPQSGQGLEVKIYFDRAHATEHHDLHPSSNGSGLV